MKNIFALMLFFSISAVTYGQETQVKAENEGWLVNLEEAYKQSKETGKPILANFTGSDWCGWCKRLTRSVFVHDEFKEWADDNVILLELDFPRRKQLPDDLKKQNQDLQRAFNVRGYPTIWVFDLERDQNSQQFNISALGKTGYTKTVAEFTDNVDQMIAKRTSGE